MVTAKENPPGEAVGLLDNGKINIGTPEQMKAKFEAGNIESEAAEAAVAEMADADKAAT